MNLIRSGSILFATDDYTSGSIPPNQGPRGPGHGRVLNLAESHLSGNTRFDVYPSAEWNQVGNEINVAISASDNSQYTDRFRNCMSWQFWDTDHNVSQVKSVGFDFIRSVSPAGDLDTHNPIMVLGFCTAPVGKMKEIIWVDGAGASEGDSWSSIRWSNIRFATGDGTANYVGVRQGENTFSFGAGPSGDSVDIGLRFFFRGEIVHRLDGKYYWEYSELTTNYPGSNHDWNNINVKTQTTSFEISSGDHRIYAFIGVGRGAVAGNAETIQGKYTIYLG